MRYKLFSIIILLFIAFSCDREYSTENLKIFRYNEAAGISSLDPAFSRDLANLWACNQIYDGLVKLNEDLEVEPSVARAWKISPDGKTYTFYLRKDVFFHDHELFLEGKGRRVTAFDFKYSFDRIIDAQMASPGAWVFNNVAENGFSAINDSVFQIKIRQPFMPFLGLLAMQYCSVIPQELADHFGKDFRKNPVGCGPFVYKYWKEGVKLVLRKNTNYYEIDNEGVRLPYLDAISISFLIDKQSAFLQFIQGNIDFISGIDASYKDELLTPEGKLNPEHKDKIYLITEPYLNTEYLGILVDTSIHNEEMNPLSIKLIRKAIAYGFDRKKMMRYLRNNIGRPGNGGIIPAGLPAFDTTDSYGYSYDPVKTKELLAEAGYPAGKGLPQITLTTSSEYLDLCKYIQHELMQHGIEINISVSPPAAIKEMKAQAKIPFFRASWIADYPDPENYLSLFYSKNFSPSGPNYTHYASEEFDMLYERSLGMIDNTIRNEAYREMDRLIMSESPVIILFYDEVLRFVRKEISGLGSNPINMLDLSKVKREKHN